MTDAEKYRELELAVYRMTERIMFADCPVTPEGLPKWSRDFDLRLVGAPVVMVPYPPTK
jgi:hypothetical protein